MRSELFARSVWTALPLRFVAIVLCVLAVPAVADSQPAPGPQMQIGFSTPQQATDALIQAAATYDVPTLREIFGRDGEDFIASADPIRDKSLAVAFAARARQKNVVTIDPKNKTQAVVSVGMNDWPLPIPIVKRQNQWYFDSKAGREEILFRRIGANELDAIEICRGFADAQKQYASEPHDDSGINQYAQKIISTPGKRDGLYWANDDGTPGGPISKAIARAIEEGYDPKVPAGYHGYYFKVLKGQGPAAPLGQLDYVIEGVMIGGFALVAFPAEYRVTGVKTFMVSYDGIVYEKDLGPDSLNLVKNMERYNPDKTWHRTDDEWPADIASAEE
jgi:hypothetical protein